jgi:hypothetical protein
MAEAAPERVWLFNNVKYSQLDKCIAAAVEAKRKGKAPYWSKLRIATLNGEVRVVCVRCEKDFSPSNISRRSSDHFKQEYSTCVSIAGKGKRGAADVAAPAGDAGPSSSSKRSKASSTVYLRHGAGGAVVAPCISSMIDPVADRAMRRPPSATVRSVTVHSVVSIVTT